MSNAVFPVLPGLAWSISKTPEYATRIQRAASGLEVRAALRSTPLYTFKLSFELLRADASQELQTLLGFFINRQGAYDSFLFLDQSDYAVSDQVFASGDGATTHFQLARSYGGALEPVCWLASLANIKRSGVVTNAYTVSDTGVVNFATPLASGETASWTGSFYYRCRFVNDTTEFEQFMRNLWAVKSLEMVGSTGIKV